VVGLARSGLAAARLLARRGARVVATDVRVEVDLEPEVLTLAQQGITLELGGHRTASFTGADMVVVSPGVPTSLPELAAARARNVPVIGELELAWRYMSGPVAAITGTKGKSTTTAALGAMLSEAGRDVRVGGNIGAAASGLVEGADAETVFALEVSSFQLELTDTFRPHVAVFLNLSADHLDRHRDLEEYAAAKGRVFANQTPDDWAVVNADDPLVRAQAREARARRLALRAAASTPSHEDSAYLDGDEAILERGGAREVLFTRSSVHLPGLHLTTDLLAAAAAARLLDVPRDAIARAVAGFRGSEHVLEHVAVVGGVAFFNDSKATNVQAVRSSLEAFDTPLLPIMGGRYKGGDFASLADAVAGRAKAIFGIGEACERIRRDLAPVVAVICCQSLAEAVSRAHAAASPGDTVLLAPGCSSFDMFRDYAERGRAFKAEVARLGRSHG
jgi:UDP-N-acetylmuramoylalanine--D-glutamate ligase